MEVKEIKVSDDLEKLTLDIKSASWDEGNDIQCYSESSLRAYLERQDSLFLACYLERDGQNTLLGIASARLEWKPYADRPWLYVDEIDTCCDYRRKGVATKLMSTFFNLAKDKDCDEVWLGAESTNLAAQKLYQSLSPQHADLFMATHLRCKSIDIGWLCD
jgi:ribosomal protein S18 acetylase RimI-like enzyme